MLWQAGYSLSELIVVIAIAGVLASISLSGVQSFAKRDGVSQAANQVVGLLEIARTQAQSSAEVTALLLSVDPDDESSQQRLAVASLVGAQEDLRERDLVLKKRWQILPKGTMIEVAYSDAITPNVFATMNLDGYELASERSAQEGGKTTVPRVHVILFDRYGALLARTTASDGELDNVTYSQYYNRSSSAVQKGAYVVVRQGVVTDGVVNRSMVTGSDPLPLSQTSRIYISPLTGKISQLAL